MPFHGAGEIGQTSIDYQGRPGHYGNLGALEEYVGNGEIAADARDAYAAAGIRNPSTSARPPPWPPPPISGDPIALAQWDEIGRILATAVMNCCWLLNPEAIVIGGGSRPGRGTAFQAPSRNISSPSFPAPLRINFSVLSAAFGHEAGTIGAAALARECAGIETLIFPLHRLSIEIP